MEQKLNPTPKLELRISTKKLAQLEVVKQRAKVRTNRRIQAEIEERELKELELRNAGIKDEMVTVSEPIVDTPAPDKKGK